MSMHFRKVVLTGSGVNKKGDMLPVDVLFNTLEFACEGVPSFINHDYHKLYGWIVPGSLIFNDHSTLLWGKCFIPDNYEEKRYIASIASEHIKSKMTVEDEDKISIINKFKKSRDFIQEIINIGTSVVAYGDKILRIEHPELFNAEDEDGLIPIDYLYYEGHGIFSYKEHLIFPSCHFRKSSSNLNSLNEEFLNFFVNGFDAERKLIAIDDTIIGLKSTLLRSVELDYWWGPKFKKNINEIEDGVTRHVVPEESPLRKMLGVEYVDFRWSTNKESSRVFECEEVVFEQTYGISNKEAYCCKYMHSIFAKDESCVHVDGAVRSYSDTELLKRFDSDLAKCGKNTEYMKIWRVDGRLDRECFMKLVHFFYRGNTLISEYFCDESSDFFENQIADIPNVAQSKTIGVFDDIIVSTGFMKQKRNNSCNIVINSTHTYGEEQCNESSYIDLKKIFMKNGVNFCENKFKIIHFNDTVVNLPTITHFGTDSFTNANRSLLLIKDFIQSSAGLACLISFTIACEVDESADKIIFFSFAGTRQKICDFIEKCKIPQSHDLTKEWCIEAENFMKQKDNSQLERHVLDFISADATLKFDRILLHVEDIIVDNGILNVKFKDSVEKSFSQCFIVDEMTCPICGENYCTCKCISNQKYKFKTSGENLAFFHTDRPLNLKWSLSDES